MTAKSLLKTLDYALLKPEVSMHALLHAAELCEALGIKCLCVKSCDVPFAKECLGDCDTLLAAVVGFPHGNTVGTLKAMEAQLASTAGADEIDMVINVSALKDGDTESVEDEIRAVVTAVYPKSVKVILETALLTEPEMNKGVVCAIRAGAAFVKTSTGFNPAGGASPEAVRVLVAAAEDKIEVKASGGIRTREDAEAYLEMGCTRLGVGNVLCLLSESEKKHLGLGTDEHDGAVCHCLEY